MTRKSENVKKFSYLRQAKLQHNPSHIISYLCKIDKNASTALIIHLKEMIANKYIFIWKCQREINIHIS